MFTFVVTCYNQAQVVLQALESVKYQIKKFGQGQAFQLIVTDDGSTDGSPDWRATAACSRRKGFCSAGRTAASASTMWRP